MRRIRLFDPRLPPAVRTLQVGGLFNAFGNGAVLPFALIYLHNIRGISLTTAGLVLAANAFVSLLAGPFSGPLVDRVGGRRVLALALVLLAAGFGSYVLVHHPWQAFVAATITGLGNGFFWPAQSTLIAGLTPQPIRHLAFATQRVVMNLGVGLGALAGGLIASAEHPWTFTVLFVFDAITFLAYLGVLYAFIPAPELSGRTEGSRPGSYRQVLANRAFMVVIGLNSLFILGGFAGFELLPVYAKNEAGVSESAIGVVFFVNTAVIVLAQLPISSMSEGRRRMPVLGLLGLTWAASWLLVPVAGLRLDGYTAALLLAGAMALFAIGECLHGAVHAPLVVDLAEPHLYGRYMALSALSWSVGFALGPALGAPLLDRWPSALWVALAGICLVTGVLALAAERVLPRDARRTPGTAAPSGKAPGLQ